MRATTFTVAREQLLAREQYVVLEVVAREQLVALSLTHGTALLKSESGGIESIESNEPFGKGKVQSSLYEYSLYISPSSSLPVVVSIFSKSIHQSINQSS
jgi:hypothetical protein